jgi:hypothetical protein
VLTITDAVSDLLIHMVRLQFPLLVKVLGSWAFKEILNIK